MVAIFSAAQVHTFTCYAEIGGLHTRKRGKSVYSLIRFVAVDIMKVQRLCVIAVQGRRHPSVHRLAN